VLIWWCCTFTCLLLLFYIRGECQCYPSLFVLAPVYHCSLVYCYIHCVVTEINNLLKICASGIKLRLCWYWSPFPPVGRRNKHLPKIKQIIYFIAVFILLYCTWNETCKKWSKCFVLFYFSIYLILLHMRPHLIGWEEWNWVKSRSVKRSSRLACFLAISIYICEGKLNRRIIVWAYRDGPSIHHAGVGV